MVDVNTTIKDISKLLSHPKKLLIQHHREVTNRALCFVDDYRVRMASLLHDIGKGIVKPFQNYIRGEDINNQYKNHSYAGALALLSYIKINKIKKIFVRDLDFYIVFLCILKHHGGLPNFFDYEGPHQVFNLDEMNRLMKYLNENWYNPPKLFFELMEIDYSMLDFDFNLNTSDKIIKSYMESFKRESKKITDPLDFLFELRICFSAVINGDKGDAGDYRLLNECANKLFVHYDADLEAYIRNKLNKKSVYNDNHRILNEVRTQIRTGSAQRLKEALIRYPEQRLFSLTEPTGAGKTLLLLVLAGIIKAKDKRLNKIVYAIPFLSITEQVHDVLKEIFQPELIKRIDSKADPRMNNNDDNDEHLIKMFITFMKKLSKKVFRNDEIKEILNTAYREQLFDYPLIVTTFVQFFQSFTTASNRGLMRFSGLTNSIFLIDEIQSLPPRLYTFFTAMLGAFCRKYNCYAIFSTATMPNFSLPMDESELSKKARALFKDYVSPTEIGNLEDFSHKVFNRYILNVIKEPLKIDTLTDKLLEQTGPTMIVLNTIRDSKTLYRALVQRLNGSSKVLLLNTYFHSNDRTRILSEVNQLIDKKERFFFVSTQVVEAGIDIDFETVFRDIAPIPNIVQTFGRCNRNGRREGYAYVFILIKEDKEIDPNARLKNSRAQTIFRGNDSFFLNQAFELLFESPQDIFQEKDLLVLQKQFFDMVGTKTIIGEWDEITNIDESGEKKIETRNFINQLNRFEYGSIGEFALIPEEHYYDQVQIYIPDNFEDNSYEKLFDLYAQKACQEETAGMNIDSVMRIVAQIKEQRKIMMGRVVQANLKPEEKEMLLASEPIFKLHKIKDPKFYNHVTGLQGKGDI